MSLMRRWWLVGGLLLVQAGIVLVFLQLQSASPSEAVAAQAPVDESVSCPVPSTPVAPVPSVTDSPTLPAPTTQATEPPPPKPDSVVPAAIIPADLGMPQATASKPSSGWNIPNDMSGQAPAPKPVVCPWTFHLVVVEGRTVLTAKIGDEVQFKVTCDKLDLQAPGGTIQATGAIKLTSAGLNGSAERLTINLREDRVILDGQAHLKARRQSQELELQAECLSLRIGDGRLGDSAEAAEPPANVRID